MKLVEKSEEKIASEENDSIKKPDFFDRLLRLFD